MLPPNIQDQFIGLFRHALRFVVPVECIACGMPLGSDPVPFFCRLCWKHIVPFEGPSCACCAQPFVSSAATSFTPNHHCQSCLERPPAYRRALTLFPYLPPLQEAICSFKYRGKIGLARPLARLMMTALPREVDADVIMPVPLHPTRLRAREFNQSLLLADHLGRHMGKPVSATNLVRVLATDPQTTLSRRERLRNLRNAFAVCRPDSVVGRRILLVDDVFTTGTTLNECAKVLLQAGAESVCALTLARTVDASLVPDRLFAVQATRSLSVLGI
jgi:ComF family protein